MYNWINNIVYGIIDKYSTNNIYYLYNYLNIQLIRLSPYNILLRNKDAFYCRDFKGYESVFIRNNLDSQFEQFILKHELGHALCHPDLFQAGYSNANIGKLEKEANYFALKLSNIDLDSISLEGMTLEQIAAYNNVPYEVLKQFYD